MSAIQEVTNQLMKSVKELADWEYPLSQVLEKYYCLLEDPTDINYGEAALVVQNSADVYSKRVDYLDKEVYFLNQNFLEHEAEEEKAKTKRKERKSRKTIIDFDNFEPLDFNKEIGKNINMKMQLQKPVKLLNRRFTQLETSVAQVRFPIDVSDIHGELIGKKYDFRCNQQLTITGMLVDECMPSDFDHLNPPTFHQEEMNANISFLSSNSPSRQQDSLFNDIVPISVNSELTESMTTTLPNENSMSVPDAESTHISLPNGTTEDCTSQEDDGYFTLSVNNNDSEQITKHIQNTDSSQNNKSLENKSSENNESSNMNSNGVEETVEEIEMSNSVEGISQTMADEPDHFEDNDYDLEDHEISNEEQENREDCANIRNSPECLNNLEELNVSIIQPEVTVNGNNKLADDETSPIMNGRSKNKNPEIDQDEDENGSGNCKETDSGYRSGESEDYEIPRRGSKMMKNMVCVVNDINKNIWKPIPFDQGIPEKLPKSRSKFKLPCHISLLKSKSPSRKRKHLTEQQKPESLPMFLMNEAESPMKKMNMYSPSRPFMPLKKEELLDFQKSFEDCFKSRQCCDVFHYEAATTITMDLLGFFPSFTKHDPLSNSLPFKTLAPTPEHVSASCSDPGFSPRPDSPRIVIFDSNTPPESPAMPDDSFDVEEPLHSTLNYQQIIEFKMREICEEFDVRTDLEHNVARWHKIIKPKLQEAEQRPPFHIYDYAGRIVKKLNETAKRRIDFDDVIVDQTPAEIARYFSAALQLANTYNVDIKTDESKTNIELILLNSDIVRNKIPCETPKSSKAKRTKRHRYIT